LELLPPESKLLPEAEIEEYFNEFYEQISEQMPSTFEIDESVISTISPEIMPLLEQARRYIGYLQIAYRAVMVALPLLIMGIILLDRRVKGATRWIGIPCLVCGIFAYVSNLIARYFVGIYIPQLGLPVQLQAWLPHFLDRCLAPMQIYGIVLMATGTALLIVSFVYKRRQPEV